MPDHGFTLEYPSDYLLEEFEPPFEKGELAIVRFFDQEFASTYPEGQISVGVYANDASTLDAWLEKHSSTRDWGEDGIYYPDPIRHTSTTMNGRVAIAFDWEGPTIPTIHEVAFLSRNRVITFSWFGGAEYQAIFDRMLESYGD